MIGPSIRRRLSYLAFCCLLPVPGTALAQSQACSEQNPCQTQTSSTGAIIVDTYENDGRRNNNYQTRITGRIEGGDLIYDQVFYRDIDDPMTQAGIEAARQAIVSVAGPGVILFEPHFVEADYSEEIDQVFTEHSEFYRPGGTIVTVQTTSGDLPNNVVFQGDRGGCFDAGASGATNFEPFDGAFANCDGSEETVVDPGTINTNTHTTNVTEYVHYSFTNEDWIIRSRWEVVGRLVLVGFVHPAVQTGAIEMGSGFLSRLAGQASQPDPSPAAPSTPLGYGADFEARHGFGQAAAPDAESFRLWAEGYGGWSATPDDGERPGSKRSSRGLASGIVLSPPGPFSLGLAVDHGSVDIRVDGGETADLDLTQIGAYGAYDEGGWFVEGAAAYGFGDADTRRQVAGSGVSTGTMELRTLTATAQAGARFELGQIEIVPSAGIEWASVETGDFSESGGFALQSDGDESERTTAWLDLRASKAWRAENGGSFKIFSSGRLSYVLAGQTPSLPVSFVSSPANVTSVGGAAEGELAGELKIGAAFQPSDQVSFHGVAQGRWDDAGGHAYGVQAGLNIRW